jgi:tRNA A37 methylthiotransferase MiaB
MEKINFYKHKIDISSGCNQRCSFCYSLKKLPSTINRSINEIVNDCQNINEDYVYLFGNNIIEHPQLIEIVKKIIKFKSLVYLSQIHSNYNKLKELIKYDKYMGHYYIPVQSGSDNVLKNLNVEYTVQDNIKTCEILKPYANKVMYDIMIGHESETDDDFNLTIEFLKRYPPHFINIFLCYNSFNKLGPIVNICVKNKIGFNIGGILTDDPLIYVGA